jgi:hypothetical protein
MVPNKQRKSQHADVPCEHTSVQFTCGHCVSLQQSWVHEMTDEDWRREDDRRAKEWRNFLAADLEHCRNTE